MFKIFSSGDRTSEKILFLCRDTFGNILLNDQNIQIIAEYNNVDIHLLDSNFLSAQGLIRGDYGSHLSLKNNQGLQKFYQSIVSYIRNESIRKCIFFGSGYPWTTDFLHQIKKIAYTACYFADDPEGSDETSRYYVKDYQYAFCGGIYFDKISRISEMYRQWGARKSKFIPLGACPEKYLAESPIFEGRDIDLVYVGGAYLKKIIPIFRLKKHFGNRMQLFGKAWNYNGSNPIKKIVAVVVKKYYKAAEIQEITTKDLVSLYRRSKIGFNTHLSYGPSNQRLYELPINGVMQICDCETGLGELYEIGKEVVTYQTLTEAIQKIEYFLLHEQERISIARAGYIRVNNQYRLEQSFEKIFREIQKDITKNFSNKYLKTS